MELADLIESSGIYFGLAVDCLGLYLSVISGYLIVAYLVGDKLTRSQITIISTLFVVMSSLAAYAITVWLMRGAYFVIQQRAIDSTLPGFAHFTFPVLLGALLGGGVFACLKFMWDIRHPKTE
jgi:hypothetical protein